MPLVTHAEVLQSACPPREVRSFRVLLMRDACATRRPARRVVELTVWDVLTISFDEAPAGQLKEGQRFQVRFRLSHVKFSCAEAGRLSFARIC
jgi:breast cancer 2 susceptibility protein